MDARDSLPCTAHACSCTGPQGQPGNDPRPLLAGCSWWWTRNRSLPHLAEGDGTDGHLNLIMGGQGRALNQQPSTRTAVYFHRLVNVLAVLRSQSQPHTGTGRRTQRHARKVSLKRYRGIDRRRFFYCFRCFRAGQSRSHPICSDMLGRLPFEFLCK
jgi:hypothetical protein